MQPRRWKRSLQALDLLVHEVLTDKLDHRQSVIAKLQLLYCSSNHSLNRSSPLIMPV
jgi:hypothetical protein